MQSRVACARDSMRSQDYTWQVDHLRMNIVGMFIRVKHLQQTTSDKVGE